MKTKRSNIELQNVSNFQDWFPLELLKDLSFPNTFKELPTRVIALDGLAIDKIFRYQINSNPRLNYKINDKFGNFFTKF